MRKLANLLILGTVLATCACTKVVTDITIPYTPELVIESFISPQDTLLFVRVSATRPTLGVVVDSLAVVTRATVTLSDGSRTVLLPFDGRRFVTKKTETPASYTETGYHVNGYSIPASKLPILAGRTYTLRVEAAGFQMAEAQCTVPAAFDPAAVTLLKGTPVSKPLSNNKNTTQALTVQWSDVPGQANYYGVQFNVNFGADTPPGSFYESGTDYISDENRDGERLSSAKAEAEYNNQAQPFVTVYLAHADRNYFEFNRTLRNQNRNGQNPFAEPALIFSNVRGGLGVFSAYQLTTVKVGL